VQREAEKQKKTQKKKQKKKQKQKHVRQQRGGAADACQKTQDRQTVMRTGMPVDRPGAIQ
jgi:hypothetical protein